jgi:glucose/arabinose dehydrogenase
MRLTPIALAVTLIACSGNAPSTAQDQANLPPPYPDAQVPRNAPAGTVENVPATENRGNITATPAPFTVSEIGKFDTPFAMAFLPDGRLLVTEKAGKLKLRATDGSVADVAGVPTIAAGGQGGLLDVAIAPDFAKSKLVYISYSEPGPGGRMLALARAKLDSSANPALQGLNVIWRSGSSGPGQHFGANILFSPDGRYLFLSGGERQRFTPAQDLDQALGKILRLTLDGKPAPGNPMASAGGVKAATWSSGHRNPYGLAFTPDGQLWEAEMGPQGGDELNLIEPGKNYGWPLVSNGDNYSGQAIPDHPSRPDLTAPKLWWNPSISPGGMMLYTGSMFPQYKGSLLLSALSGQGLVRIAVDGDKAHTADYWDMGTRIRDVAQASDGSIWLLGDGATATLMRLTPK